MSNSNETAAKEKSSSPFEAFEKDSEAIWRLVNARCEQLRQAVIWAWAPIALSISFTLYLAATIYVIEHGFILARLEMLNEDSDAIREKTNTLIRETCERLNASGAYWDHLDCEKTEEVKSRIVNSNLTVSHLLSTPHDHCVKIFKEGIISGQRGSTESVAAQYEKLERCRASLDAKKRKYTSAQDDSILSATPPLGLPRMHVTDLSPIGNVTLLLLLSWAYFASRRENHSIIAFVDFDQHTRRTSTLIPAVAILQAQDGYMSAKHLCYAYQSISQRFMLIVSSHSRPARATIILLMSFPAIIASWNFYIDVTAILKLSAGSLSIMLPHLSLNALMIAAIWFVVAKTIQMQLESSAILNTWHLAVRDVWMNEWSNDKESACLVRANLNEQRARKYRPKRRRSDAVRQEGAPTVIANEPR